MTAKGDRAADGANVRARREALGLTQPELAVAAGVGARTLSQLEQGIGGHTRLYRVERALDRLERGEDPTTQVVRVEWAPGVFITINAEDEARLRDIRDAEAAVRRLRTGQPDESG